MERVMGKQGFGELTGRQLKIALLIAQGSTDRAIAEVVGCSVATVRSEINQITSKLEANNRAHIAYLVGLRHGVEWCVEHVPQNAPDLRRLRSPGTTPFNRGHAATAFTGC